MNLKGIINTIACIFIFSDVEAQLSVNMSLTPQQLVQNILVGPGVTVSNVKYTGSPSSIGYFTTGSTSTNLGISDGIVMSTGYVDGSYGQYPIGSVAGNTNSISTGNGSDTSLANLVSGYLIKDASVLEFDFIPLSDTIKFRYVFASEEYPEWVGSSFNDVFGFFVSGENPDGGTYTNYNIAMIPGTNIPVTINNVNGSSYSQFYTDNSGGVSIVYDGFTTVITAWCKVTPCIPYHIKLAIGDASDAILDSAVFLEKNSFSTDAVGMNTVYSTNIDTMAIEGCNDAIINFSLSHIATSPIIINYTITGTATNGVDYSAIPESVTIPAEQSSKLLIISPTFDGVPEGIETVKLTIKTSICDNIQSVTVYIRDNTQIVATVESDTSVCPGSEAILIASGFGGIQPYSYHWNNDADTNSTISVYPFSITTYVVTINDACGNTATDNAVISIINESVLLSNDTIICYGGTAFLMASGSANYQWSNATTGAVNTVNPLQNTVYYITATNICNVYDSVIVTVRNAPNIIASSASPSICYGEGVSLNVGGGFSYSWSSSPIDSTLTSQSTSTSPFIYPTQTTLYTVLGTDEYNCVNTSSISVMVYPIPIAEFSVSDSDGCIPFMVTYRNLSQNTNIATHYSWQFGDGIVSSIENPNHTYYTAGTYSVTLVVTNGDDCSDTITMHQIINVYPLPKAYFVPVPSAVSIFDPVVGFYDQSIDPVQWHWSLGNGDTSSLQNFFYTYSDTGTYNVSLTVWNEYGCVDSINNQMVVLPDYTIFVPNSFTPDNNSKNDDFKAYGTGILEFNMRIFNRWGNLLFETNDINEGWNGVTPEGKAPVGVYTYVLNYRDALKMLHTVYGHIYLIR